MNFRILAASVLLGALTLTGCGGRMGQVTGKVTIDNQPVVNATVSFEDAVTHVRASGVTDAEGIYSLSTNVKDDGAPVGDYKVAVIQAGPADSSQGDPPRQFPKSFENPETSGLTFSVKPGKNRFDIELPKAGP